MNTLPQAGMPSQAALAAQNTSRDADNASGSGASSSDASSFHNVLSQQVAQSKSADTANGSASTSSTTTATPNAPPSAAAAAAAAQAAAVHARAKTDKSETSAIVVQPAAHAALVQPSSLQAAAAAQPVLSQAVSEASADTLASATSINATTQAQASAATVALASIAGKAAEAQDGAESAADNESSSSGIASPSEGANGHSKAGAFQLSGPSLGSAGALDTARGITATSSWSGADGSANPNDARSSQDKAFLGGSDSVNIPTNASAASASFSDAASATAAAGASTAASGTAAPTQTAVASATVPYQLGSDAWRQDVSSHVLYFSQQDMQVAQLHLSPQHLGPLNIEIRVENNQTSIAFSAAHEATRQAMQDSLPQLHEMFAQHGVGLGSTTVGDGSAGSSQFSQAGTGSQGRLGDSARIGGAAQTSTEASAPSRMRSLSMVDTFA